MLNHYREKYNVGTRVRLTRMNDPYTKLKLGETGTVVGVDDIGTIHVSWDCGYKLGIVYGEDCCEIIED